MPRRRSRTLTQLELEIMQIVWKEGETTVNDISDGLRESDRVVVPMMWGLLRNPHSCLDKVCGMCYFISNVERIGDTLPTDEQDHMAQHWQRTRGEAPAVGGKDSFGKAPLRRQC